MGVVIIIARVIRVVMPIGRGIVPRMRGLLVLLKDLLGLSLLQVMLSNDRRHSLSLSCLLLGVDGVLRLGHASIRILELLGCVVRVVLHHRAGENGREESNL